MRLKTVASFVGGLYTLGSSLIAQTWTGMYDPALGTLPTAQGWTLDDSNGVSPAATVSGSVLRQGPTSFSGYQYWQRNDITSDFSSAAGRVVEARLRITSSTYGPGGFANTWRAGYTILISDSLGRVMQLGIADNGLRISTDPWANNTLSSPFIALDTTSGFRTYRLVANGSQVSLFVDGLLTTSLPLGATSTSVSIFFFADGTSGGSMQSELQYLRWGNSATGACCNRWTGNCGLDEQSVCVSRGLRFLGAGSTCSPATCRACPTDFDGNGTVSVDDIFGFISAWFAGCP